MKAECLEWWSFGSVCELLGGQAEQAALFKGKREWHVCAFVSVRGRLDRPAGQPVISSLDALEARRQQWPLSADAMIGKEFFWSTLNSTERGPHTHMMQYNHDLV